MDLNSKQQCYLRGLAQPLNLLVRMGKSGYSETLVKEVERSLGDHELIKVRLAADDRSAFRELAAQLAEATASDLVQTIGRIAVLYRPAAEAGIKLP